MSTVWHPSHHSLWLIVTLGLLSAISMVASAQNQSKTTTIRGYYCGESTGMHAGDFGFRVGNKVQIFHINFSQRQGNTKLVGFNPGSVILGTEYTITYTGNDGNLFFADAVKSTGRMKDVLPCDVMQEHEKAAVAASPATEGKQTKRIPKQTPFVDKGACPGEGCTYGNWKVTKTTPLRTQPDIDAPVVGKVKAGTRVNAFTGEVHVIPRQFVVSKPHGRYRKGDILWVYSYVGEGYFKVQFDGKTFNEDLGFSPYGGSSGTRCQEAPECWGELKGEYQQTWWVRIKTDKGLTGWSDAENFTHESMH